MNVLYSATRNLYPCLEWSVASLKEYNDNVNVYVFAEDDDVGFPCNVINVAEQNFIRKDSPNYRTRFTHMSLMRVLAPRLLTVDKVLYLDVDTIVCDNLQPMYNTDLNGKWIAWVQERAGLWKPYGKPYFNFGVALMNLAQMRQDDVSERLVHALNERRYIFNEQDAMNEIVTDEKMVALDIRYNETSMTGRTQNPSIVHFAGIEDWQTNRTMYRSEYLDKYRSVKR